MASPLAWVAARPRSRLDSAGMPYSCYLTGRQSKLTISLAAIARARIAIWKTGLTERPFVSAHDTGKFMLSWFAGRTLRRNALRDVDTARNVMTPHARLVVARHVIAQMALIERQPGGANGAIDLQNAVLQQAKANKRATGGRKARGSDPARMAASLVEGWVSARLAATQRKISMRAYEGIDAVIWQFIADTIDPAEIRACLEDKHSDARPGRLPS
jgi:hypothetical protein